MAQHASYFQQNVNNPPPYAHNVQQEQQNQGFIVVDQQPPTRSERFPYSLPIKCIFAFSITECVIASIMIIMGAVNLGMNVNFITTYIAFPIWCGLTVSISRTLFTNFKLQGMPLGAIYFLYLSLLDMFPCLLVS